MAKSARARSRSRTPAKSPRKTPSGEAMKKSQARKKSPKTGGAASPAKSKKKGAGKEVTDIFDVAIGLLTVPGLIACMVATAGLALQVTGAPLDWGKSAVQK